MSGGDNQDRARLFFGQVGAQHRQWFHTGRPQDYHALAYLRLAMERLKIAKHLIDNVAPQIKNQGTRRVLLAPAPSPWVLHRGTLRLSLAEDVPLRADEATASSLLDVWNDEGKVFSACWTPDKPWLPPIIISIKPGPWLAQLGYLT